MTKSPFVSKPVIIGDNTTDAQKKKKNYYDFIKRYEKIEEEDYMSRYSCLTTLVILIENLRVMKKISSRTFH